MKIFWMMPLKNHKRFCYKKGFPPGVINNARNIVYHDKEDEEMSPLRPWSAGVMEYTR